MIIVEIIRDYFFLAVEKGKPWEQSIHVRPGRYLLKRIKNPWREDSLECYVTEIDGKWYGMAIPCWHDERYFRFVNSPKEKYLIAAFIIIATLALVYVEWFM